MRFSQLLLLLAPTVAPAATLTCDIPETTIIPRTAIYDSTVSTAGTDLGTNSWYAVGAVENKIDGVWRSCAPDVCTYDTVTFTSLQTGEKPFTPWASSRDGFRTNSPIGANETVTLRIVYRVTPPDGGNLAATETRIALRVQPFPAAVSLATIYGTSNYGVTYPTETLSYPAPDQHNFGDLIHSSTGTPLTLPSTPQGNLRGNILWSGPPGTTMTGNLGTTNSIQIPPDTAKNIDIAGNSLQVELLASETASPGPISGNLTLTLTCP